MVRRRGLDNDDDYLWNTTKESESSLVKQGVEAKV